MLWAPLECAHHRSVVVDRNRHAALAAGQHTQVLHRSTRIPKRVDAPVRADRAAHHLAVVVDRIRVAALAAQRAEIHRRSVRVKERQRIRPRRLRDTDVPSPTLLIPNA